MYTNVDCTGGRSDANYNISTLTSSPSTGQVNGSNLHPGDYAFGNPGFAFHQPPASTIAPYSLDLYHTSHDDSCLDKCLGVYGNPGMQRAMQTPTSNPRPRLASSIYPYQQPGGTGFHPQPQPFNTQFHIPFSDMGLNQGTGNELLMGNYFNAADLGISSQNPISDECVSVDTSNVSCPSNCCSTQVCQQEACSEDGTPCDDVDCLDHVPKVFDQIWGYDEARTMTQGWSPSANTSVQNQRCTHTNTEHDVALTLRDLGAPDAPNVPQDQQYNFSQYDCQLGGASGHHADLMPQPSSHNRSYSSVISTTPDLDSASSPVEEAIQAPALAGPFVCQWKCAPEGLGAQTQVCGQVCKHSAALHDHLCTHHVPMLDNKTNFVCSWKGCPRDSSKGFPSRNKLARHIFTHSGYKPFRCEICGESFSAQQALEQHIRTHTGEAPFKCDAEGCGKSFKQKSALTMHRRTHTGERPLMCDDCGKTFGESSNLTKHRKTHNPDPRHKCDYPGCSAKFIRADQLRRHQLGHSRVQRTRMIRQSQSLTPSIPPEPVQQQPLPNDLPQQAMPA
ncbi:hypothetical protein GGR52DRAFT_540234 [Hypoxylon sp. FL1284]|nr:hypothetical protein GGR52DRAFT_540234 [Hypoxylon sp. FL1284]